MSERETRPAVYGDGISYASPALLRLMNFVQDSAFEQFLTPAGLDDFYNRLIELDPGAEEEKVLVQLYFKDPSKDVLTEEDSAWIGCQYSILTDAEYHLNYKFESMVIPSACYDPLYDPRWKGHHHMVISDDDIHWPALEDTA